MNNEKTNTYVTPYDLDGRIPAGQAVIFGLQHVLAMFVGNLTPLLVIGGVCGLADAGIMQQVLQSSMLVAGIVSLVQLIAIGPVGGHVPIIMGTSSGFIGICTSIANSMGGGIIGYGALMGASLIGGLFEGVLGFFIRPLRRFFPAVVTGTVVLAIGLSLISVGINSFGGGNNNPDFGSPVNLLIAAVVLISIIGLKHYTKGISSTASILFGIIIGYILCAILAFVVPTTYTYVDPETQQSVTQTCSWVLNFSSVAGASWFALPKLMPVAFVFDYRAILPMLLMFVVTAVETIGDVSACMEGGCGREATDKELSGSVVCDGLGSSFATLFGVLPNTSFSQNVGLVGMTKVVNTFALSMGALILVLCGFIPKLAALFQMMPQCVLGGAAVFMFSSIIISGIQLITKHGVTTRVVTIVAISLGLGYGLGTTAGVLSQLPEWVGYIFGGSGIVPAAVVAIILNLILPKDASEDPAACDQKEEDKIGEAGKEAAI